MNASPTSATPALEPGEKLIARFAPDRRKYWRDHGIMALVLMAVAGLFLWLIGSPYPAIGSLGAILAVGVRAAYLASETLNMRWTLTDRRLILPGGQRSILLSGMAQIRILLGDVQVITVSGDKHLLKHMADSPETVRAITTARDRRAKRRAD
ncbi:MAG: hypothetical protein ACK4GT_06955 [Pararhodobacter sp.]